MSIRPSEPAREGASRRLLDALAPEPLANVPPAGEPPPSSAVVRFGRWVARLARDDVMLRELRSLMKARRFVGFLVSGTLLVLLVTVVVAWTHDASSSPSLHGQIVFQVFFCLAATSVCATAPTYGASMISSERERGTFEALILTRLTRLEIVRGKIAACVVAGTLLFLAQLPTAAIAFVFGGVTLLHVFWASVALLLLMVVTTSIAVAVSALAPSAAIANGGTSLSIVGMMFVMISGLVGGYSELGRPLGAMVGPLWFTDLLARQLFEPRVFTFLLLFPLVAAAMVVWLAVTVAILGLRAQTEDRSTPIKAWAVGASVALMLALAVLAGTFGPDAAKAGPLVSGFLLLCAFSTLDGPLLPRRLRSHSAGLRGRALRYGGPHALGSIRFWGGLFATVALACVAAFSFGLALRGWTPSASAAAASLFVELIGSATVATGFAVLLAWLRTGGHSAKRAVLIAGVVLVLLTFLPPVFTLVMRGDLRDPLLSTMISPWCPSAVGHFMRGSDHPARTLMILPTLFFYGGTALVLSVGVVRRVRAATAIAEARAARLQHLGGVIGRA